MLLQSLLGVSDEEIIDDYFRSNGNFHKPGKSHDGESSVAAAAAAAATKATKGKLDRRIFSGTNRQAMVDTLAFLREHYGSVSPGYLDAIGFDERWRRRLKAVLEAQGTHVISDAKTTSSEEEEGEYVDVPRSRL